MKNHFQRGGLSFVWLLGLAFLTSKATAQLAPEEPAEETVEEQEPPSTETPTAPAATTTVAPAPSAEKVAPTSGIVDVEGGLTSDQAAEAAAAYSLDARAAQEDIHVANAEVSRTIYNYAPRLTLTASYTRYSVAGQDNVFGEGSLVGTTGTGDVTGGPLFAIPSDSLQFNPVPNQWYLNAGVVIPISDYVLNMSQAFAGANAAKKSAQTNEKAARVSAAANARLTYYNWVRARLKLVEVKQAVSRAQSQKKSLEDLFRGGRVSRADVLRQDAFLASAEFNLRRAETQEIITREELYAQMNGGSGTAPEWAIGEDVTTSRAGDEVKSGDLEKLKREAEDSRLELQAFDDQVFALEKRAYVERTQGYPRVEGFGNLTYANPNPRYFPQANEWNGSWDVGVRMIWTLNDLGAKTATGKSTDAQIAKLRAQQQKVKDGVRTEVVSSFKSVQEARLARESAVRGLESAQLAYEDRVRLFQAGKSTSFDVLDAETALINAELNLVDAHIAMRMARVRLDHALGRDIDEVVKAPRSREE